MLAPGWWVWGGGVTGLGGWGGVGWGGVGGGGALAPLRRGRNGLWPGALCGAAVAVALARRLEMGGRACSRCARVCDGRGAASVGSLGGHRIRFGSLALGQRWLRLAASTGPEHRLPSALAQWSGAGDRVCHPLLPHLHRPPRCPTWSAPCRSGSALTSCPRPMTPGPLYEGVCQRSNGGRSSTQRMTGVGVGGLGEGRRGALGTRLCLPSPLVPGHGRSKCVEHIVDAVGGALCAVPALCEKSAVSHPR